MFKLEEVAPDIAALAAEHAKHADGCTADPCERCGRDTAREVSAAKILRSLEDIHRARALESLPAGFDAATLDAPWLESLVGSNTIAAARASLASPRVAFVGPPGAGKTSLAIAMFRAAVLAGSAAGKSRYRYTSAHALAKARAGHPLGEGEAPLVEACLRSPLLLIDELGGEDTRYSSATAEVIYERHAEGRPTWVTSGVGPQELANRYGGGIARRIFEGAQVFRLTRRGS